MRDSKSKIKQFKYWGNLLVSYAHWLCHSCRLLLIFWLQNSFCDTVILNLWNFTALPLIQMIVFLCCPWSFCTFNHNSCPFLYSSLFLKVWISLSIIYRRTFALTWAPSFPDVHIFIYWCPLSTPLSVNVIIECPLCYFFAVS